MREIDNPFDGEAVRLIRDQGMKGSDALDEVVLRYLRQGDTRPLAHWLVAGYCPGEEVRLLLSAMLQPDRETADEAQKVISFDPEEVPYWLEPKRRDGKKGRKRDLVSDERNQVIDDAYRQRLDEVGPGGSDSVIAEMVEEFGPVVSESMIREAIKNRSRKSGQGKK